MNSVSDQTLKSKQELAGSTALVTGGTSGIGRETAFALAELGAHVIISGRDVERGEATVAALRALGAQADFVAQNLQSASDAQTLAEKALELSGGRIDILINNAGIAGFGSTALTTEEQVDSMFALNVKAPYFLVAALAPKMAERGHGAIVNLSTMVADFGMPGLAFYGSTKAALELLTKAWAGEFGPSGVRVNAVSPGPTRTEGNERMGDGLTQLAAKAPAGRPATMREIANAVVYMATDRSSFVQGAILHVDGGRTAV